MKCNSKVKHTCGETNYSVCVSFEGEPNTQSELHGEGCLDQEQVTQDIYNQIEDILNESNLEGLGNCVWITYEKEDGKNILKNVLKAYEDKICELQARIQDLENI